MKKLLFLSLVVVMVASIIFSGCGEPEETTQPTTTQPTSTPTPTDPDAHKYGGKLTIARNTGITEIGAPMDLQGGWGGVTYPLWCPVVETLIIVDAAGKIVPQLAESVEVAPDGLSATFHLRKGVKFHDGTDFNAEAVKINLETVIEAEVAGSAPLQSIESFDIIDDHTIVLNFITFDATALLCLAQLGVGVMMTIAVAVGAFKASKVSASFSATPG